MYHLLSVPFLPLLGYYYFQEVSAKTFATILRRSHKNDDVICYLGRDALVQFLNTLAGTDIATVERRRWPVLEDGDGLLIAKLRYCPLGPANESDWTVDHFQFLAGRFGTDPSALIQPAYRQTEFAF